MTTLWGRFRTPPGPLSGRGVEPPVLWLGTILGSSVVGPDGEHLGHLRDIGLTRTPEGPLVDALLVDAGGHVYVLPAERATSWHSRQIRLSRVSTIRQAAYLDAEPAFEWLGHDLVGKPVLTEAARPDPTLVSDVGFRRRRDGRLLAWLVDSRPVWQRRLGRARRTTPWAVPVRHGTRRTDDDTHLGSDVRVGAHPAGEGRRPGSAEHGLGAPHGRRDAHPRSTRAPAQALHDRCR